MFLCNSYGIFSQVLRSLFFLFFSFYHRNTIFFVLIEFAWIGKSDTYTLEISSLSGNFNYVLFYEVYPSFSSKFLTGCDGDTRWDRDYQPPWREEKRDQKMKVLCDVCERSEAAVLCCADEAALCWQCDDVVHAANKLARKHQRVPLLPRLDPPSSSSPSSSNPLCDICQVLSLGYFSDVAYLICSHQALTIPHDWTIMGYWITMVILI